MCSCTTGSDGILPAWCPQPPEPLFRRLPYPLDHHHKVTPLHRIALRVLVVIGQPEAACFQTLHIHHHTTVLGMEQLHQTAALPDEDEYVAIADIAPHPLMHNAAERTDALTHVCTPRAQPVAHRVIQAEHGI